MTTSSNAYCAVLGIRAPRVEDAKSSPDASYYSLLLVALLECGEPMTLEDVAVRLAVAGVARSPGDALASLRRSRPARAPIYRDGNQYALDPHDNEVSFWLFRLGLRPPRVAPLKVVRSAPDPLPSPDHQLTVANLNEAWRDGVPNSWSAQRVAVVVLDAHGAAMAPAEVLAFGGTRSQWTLLRAESAQYWRSGADVLARVVSLRWMWTSTASSTAFAAAHPETAPTYNARHRVADSRRFQRVCPESWVISGRSSVGKSVGVGCRVMGAGVVVLRPPDERIRQASLGRHGRDPRPGHEPAGGAGPTAE